MTSTQTVQLTITPYTPSTLPSEQALITAGKALLDTVDQWKEGKTYQSLKAPVPYSVKTYSRLKQPGDEAGWHARYSEHNEGTFEEFWEGLGRNKAVNEREFIPELDKVSLLQTISPTQTLWTLHYKFMPPISPRVFTVLQVTYLTGGEAGKPREGWVISIPVDVSENPELKAKEEKGTRGRYVSVERLREGKDNIVEWLMATSSTPGGSIPQFITERSLPGQISKDVAHFVQWLKKSQMVPVAAKSAVSDAQSLPAVASEAPVPTAA